LRLPELLSPAGTLEKGAAAFHFGADAVYCGLNKFSLRSQSGNLSPDQLETLVGMAKSYGKKVFLAVNIFPYDEDLPDIESVLGLAAEIGVNAVIVSDPGVVQLAGKIIPKMPIHLSTQANTMNTQAAAFWFRQGVDRVILARECSLDAVRRICSSFPGKELEVFIHGALCISYSGRCFISKYLAGRDANRGDCAHSCRWTYKLTELQREGETFDVEEDEEGTRMFYSRDLCTISILPEIKNAGPASLKIEGRMKSLYYVAVATSVYRQALTCTKNTPENFSRLLPGWWKELRGIPNRGYTTNFFLDQPETDVVQGEIEENAQGDVFLGVFGDQENGRMRLHVKNTFHKSHMMEVLRPETTAPLILDAIWNHRGEEVDVAHSGLTVTVKTASPVVKGDILRRR